MKLNIEFEVVVNNAVTFIKANDKDNGNNLAIIEKKNNEWVVTYSALEEFGILYNKDLLEIINLKYTDIENAGVSLDISLFKADALYRLFNIPVNEDKKGN